MEKQTQRDEHGWILTCGSTSRVRPRQDIIETSLASRVEKRVQESETRLSLGDTEVVEESNDGGECL